MEQVYFAPVGLQSTALSVFVCLSVCLSVCLCACLSARDVKGRSDSTKRNLKAKLCRYTCIQYG